jgi:hypothetical protein
MSPDSSLLKANKMNTSILNGIASTIVGKAALCALDFGIGTVGQYIQCCYEVWVSEYRRIPGASDLREQVIEDVKQQLIMIGFDF